MLAVVVGRQKGKEKVVQEVISRLRKISKSEEELIRYIDELSVVASLFDVEVEVMRWSEVVERTFLFKEGLRRGLKEGIEKGRKEGLREGMERGLEKGLEKGRREGEIKGLQKAIFLDIEVRFGGEKAKLIKPKIEKIGDIRSLKFLKVKVLRAREWEEFLSSVEAVLSETLKRNRSVSKNNVNNKKAKSD